MAPNSSLRRANARVRSILGRMVLCVWVAAAAISCRGGGSEEIDVVRISVVNQGTPRAGTKASSATLWEGERSRSIHLGPLRRTDPVEPWQERVIRDEPGGVVLGRLIVGESVAALVYHRASRMDGLPRDVLYSNRLVVYEVEGASGLALWIDAAGAAGRSSSLGELDPERAARVLALSQALGAESLLRADRFPLDAEGNPRIPFFVPRPPGDWRILRERSLEIFLPPGLAKKLVAVPAFRSLRDRSLARFATALPELAIDVQRQAEQLEIPGLEAERAALQTLLTENAAALSGYLESAWIELLIGERPPDSAHVTLYVHSVVDVEVESLEVAIPHRQLVLESSVLAGLRLRPADSGAEVGVHLGQDRLEFRIGTRVVPRARGFRGFEGSVLEFDLTGLGPLGDSRRGVLDELRVRVRNVATDSPVPEEHVQRVVSLEDPRFAIGRESDVAEFSNGVGRILAPTEAGGGRLELDRDGQRFVLPSGRYRLLDDLVPPAGYGLVLEAGVEITVAPGKSLLVRGPLTVRGTPQAPVVLHGESTTSPWGVLAVQGRGRSTLDAVRPNCEVRYLELSGGSEDYLRGVHYSGQFSVYHVDLRMDHATLSNAFADDSLNVKYAVVEIQDSVFLDNAADAVDLDWVDGVVRRSFFGRSGIGGDGIDLSGSDVEVEDSVFSEFRDKCLSVGENSRLMLRGSLMRGCETGVASKDRSRVDVRGSIFFDNGRHLSAFEKKPIFGAARIHATDILVAAAERADAHDAGSTLDVTDVRPLPVAELEALRAVTAFSRDRYRALAGRTR